MNPQQSVLQQQFPLSPRKFWKKMIVTLSTWYILGIFGIGFSIFMMLIVNNSFSGYSNFSNNLNTNSIILFGIILTVAIFLISLTLLYGWYTKTYIKRYFYAGEEHFMTIKKGVFAPTEIHVQWQKIQDVYVDQDIIDRIMGLYDVHIASATATSGIEAHIDGVDQVSAEGLKLFLLNKISGGENTPSNSDKTNTTNTQQTKTVNLSEEISSNVYPLEGRWFAIDLIKVTILPFLYWAVITFFIFAKNSKNASLNLPIYYILIGYIVISILNALFNIVSTFLWRKNYAFNFTSDNIYYKGGIISISEKHMPYSSIQDVTVEQGVIERLFGLAKVRIENAAQQTIQTSKGQRMSIFSGIIIQGLNLADANKITDILKNTVLGKNTSQYGL